MKAFDVFLRDNPTTMDVFLKDKITNMDVFLKDRLSSMDVIIRTLVSREVLSFESKLLISCIANELSYLKTIEAATSMEIRAEIDRLLEAVTAELNSLMCLDVDMKIIGQKAVSAESNLVIKTERSDALLEVYNDFHNFQTITALLDSCDIRLSLGDADFRTHIGTSTADTDKTSYLRVGNEILLFGNIDFSGKKIAVPNAVNLELSVKRFGLFDMALIAGNTVMNIATEKLQDVALYPSLHGTGFDMTLQTETLGTVLGMNVFGNSKIQLLSSAVWILNKIVYPQISDTRLLCEVEAAFYRRRLLSDMDSYSLSQFDDMGLKDADFILMD